MEKKLLFTIFILFCLNVFSQDRILVGLGKTNNYIETYQYVDFLEEYSLKDAYRLGPSAIKILKDGVSTAIKWVNLNEIHQKNFTKEICRFTATDKKTFDFYKKHIDQFADEIVMTFYGYSDGTFKITIEENNGIGTFITITETDMLFGFNDLLNGKSANKEIDDIFKK